MTITEIDEDWSTMTFCHSPESALEATERLFRTRDPRYDLTRTRVVRQTTITTVTEKIVP